MKAGDARGSRAFFEENFRPLIIKVPGKFTGYFEPELRGSKVPSRLFTVPVYRKPPDLTSQPYFTRAEIEAGALKGRARRSPTFRIPSACSRFRCRAAVACSSPRAAP